MQPIKLAALLMCVVAFASAPAPVVTVATQLQDTQSRPSGESSHVFDGLTKAGFSLSINNYGASIFDKDKLAGNLKRYLEHTGISVLDSQEWEDSVRKNGSCPHVEVCVNVDHNGNLANPACYNAYIRVFEHVTVPRLGQVKVLAVVWESLVSYGTAYVDANNVSKHVGKEIDQQMMEFRAAWKAHNKK